MTANAAKMAELKSIDDRFLADDHPIATAAFKTVVSAFTQPYLSGIISPTWTRALKGVRLHALVRQRKQVGFVAYLDTGTQRVYDYTLVRQRIQVGFVAYLQVNRYTRPPRDSLSQREPLCDPFQHCLQKDEAYGRASSCSRRVVVWFSTSSPSIP